MAVPLLAILGGLSAAVSTPFAIQSSIDILERMGYDPLGAKGRATRRSLNASRGLIDQALLLSQELGEQEDLANLLKTLPRGDGVASGVRSARLEQLLGSMESAEMDRLSKVQSRVQDQGFAQQMVLSLMQKSGLL